MCPKVLVISGDFNLHLDDLRDNDTKKFMDLLETFSLSQHVSGPTHLSGHTLDLIVTRSSDDVVLASPKATFPISDHFIIQCPIGFPRPALSCKELTFRKLKNIDIAEFSADIASSVLCASVHWDNIDALSDCFNMTITDILDKHAPLKTRIMINRPKIPWFNDDIKQLKRKRRRLEKKALKTDLPGDWNNYHKVRNQYSALLKSARVNYYSNLIDQCAGDSRKLFRVVNSLSREPLETALPEYDDPTKLANEFGTFFLKKIEIIKENLDKFQVQEPRLAPVTPKENLENFSSLSIGEVSKIVRESSNASYRLDPVPTWLVKSCLGVLAPSITEMVNLSLFSVVAFLKIGELLLSYLYLKTWT